MLLIINGIYIFPFNKKKDINTKKTPFFSVICCYLFLNHSFSLLYAL